MKSIILLAVLFASISSSAQDVKLKVSFIHVGIHCKCYVFKAEMPDSLNKHPTITIWDDLNTSVEYRRMKIGDTLRLRGDSSVLFNQKWFKAQTEYVTYPK